MKSLHQTTIAFVHIPKTGGSTVIHAFEQNLGAGSCKAFSSTIIDKDFETKSFVSGHVRFDEVTSNALRFTFLRHPTAQVASHLAWIDHYNISDFKSEAVAFSASVRADIARIRDVDLSSAREITAYLKERPKNAQIRIANQQSEVLALPRTFTEQIDDADLAQRAITVLPHLNFVGLTENLQSDLEEMFVLFNLVGKPVVRHLNRSPTLRSIDLAVPAISRALEAYVRADLWLWEAACTMRDRRRAA